MRHLIHLSALVLATIPVLAQSTDITPGDLRSAATLRSVGVEWDLIGDSDHDAYGTVQHRIVGTVPWQEALPLVRVDYDGSNMLAGSVLFLEPDMTYELRIDIADPDGGSDTQLISVTTRAAPRFPAGGRTLHVTPGTGGGDGSEGNPFRGMATAWASAQPGDVFLLHAGNYGAVTDDNGVSGAPTDPIVFKAYGDGAPVFEYIQLFNHSHLRFEGLSFQYNGNDTALFSCLTNPGYDNGFQPMATDIDGIAVIRNTFQGYMHSIRLGPRTSGWYIADNTIVGDKELGIGGTESFDGEGIELAHGSDHVVAYNRISRVADGVSYPESNCDIYGNDIFDTTDDGIELDNGRANTRAWGNRIHNAAHNGIAFQPQGGAPWYIIRNQIVSNAEMPFKFRTTDRFLLLHNTIVSWSNLVQHSSFGSHILRGISRNNLWISVNGGRVWNAAVAATDWRTDLDYDGFDWGTYTLPFRYDGISYANLAGFVAASGQESHGVLVDKDSCFESFDVPGDTPTPVPPQFMTLTASCNAVDTGALLPNINDGFAGAAPDLGAYERGAGLPHYGPRPETETSFELFGTAEGGYVELLVAGVLIRVTTRPGSLPDEVAQSIADAINADSQLQSLGVWVLADASRVITNGTIADEAIGDSGLSDCSVAVFPEVDGLLINACPETNVNLSTGVYDAYQWLFEGQVIASANGQTYPVSLSGSYSVTVTDSQGCKESSAASSVTVGFCPDTEISPTGAVFPSRVEKSDLSSTGYYLYFQDVDGVEGFNLYQGSIGAWYDHGGGQQNSCDVAFTRIGTGEIVVELPDAAGDRYLLVSGFSGGSEGSSGTDSAGSPIDPTQSSCPP